MHEDESLESDAVRATIEGPTRLFLPDGLQEIVKTFGDIYDYIQPGGALDPRWQADNLASVSLPCSIPLALKRCSTLNPKALHPALKPLHR
jgi:hypothetical protein